MIRLCNWALWPWHKKLYKKVAQVSCNQLTRALEDRIAAFDNICLRRILRISYTDRVTNADIRLRASSPPQLLPLIQTRRLRFFGHVARMGDWLARPVQGLTCINLRATQGLEAPPRTSASHLASDPGSSAGNDLKSFDLKSWFQITIVIFWFWFKITWK